jgi:hypothetical protein
MVNDDGDNDDNRKIMIVRITMTVLMMQATIAKMHTYLQDLQV